MVPRPAAGARRQEAATMALSKRDRIGLLVLVGLFGIFGILLYFTVDRPDGPGRDFENNVVVQQRLKNLDNQSQ
jgi:hypothetical protein